MKKIAFVFPGQGAQYVGMGEELIENFSTAKQVYEEASEHLGFDVKKLCLEGPDEALMKTENTQPAILTTSIAMLKVLEEQGIDCHITAGLSLGEYASLVKSKVFTFEDGVKLVKNRGKYMQEAVPMGVGTMAAILGLDREQINQCLIHGSQYGVVEGANYNSPGQIVLSGEIKAIEFAVKKATELGAKKAVILPVSAPFHCSLLKGAGEKLRVDLERLAINDPSIPVVSNVNAQVLNTKEEVIPTLVQQVSRSVLWQDSIEYMLKEGVNIFIEIGPGKSLTSFIKRTAKGLEEKVETYNVENLEGLHAVLNRFN